MSDKGREAIEKLVEDIIGWYWCNSTKKMQESLPALLRSHGWLHEDDMVEGRTYCPASTEPTGECFEIKRCNQYAGGKRLCKKLPRPATVKDLIGGKE